MRSRTWSVAAVGALALWPVLTSLPGDAPVWVRTPLALVAFFAAPGLCLVGPAPRLPVELRWALVVAVSIATVMLSATLLLALGRFSLEDAQVVVLVVCVPAAAAHGLLAAREHRAARLTGQGGAR